MVSTTRVSTTLCRFNRIVLASSNPGKLREFAALFSSLNIELIPQTQLDIAAAAEPYDTFLENALQKARHASILSGLPALADDSGLCVEALDGAPGVHSARYAALAAGEKSDVANNAKLVQALAGHSARRACYVTVLVLMRHAHDPQPWIGEGRWWGEIIDTPRGYQGFGYDPHFYLPAVGKTVAELNAPEKNAVSHRAQALRQLLAKLEGAQAELQDASGCGTSQG
jgi:XTP/dITP diphosphohydrolase